MEILKLIGISFGLFYLTWFFYLAVMNLKRARDNGGLSLPVKVLGYPIAIAGVVIDAALNILVGTVVFLEPPREWLLTARLKRHSRKAGWRWRKGLSVWICSKFLDTFDPDGDHC